MTYADPSPRTPVATSEPERPERTSRRHRNRGDIQGLRAVAVGTVVLSHAGVAGFAGGYVGVDVFFVISGFLITGILAREVRRTGRVSVLDFYARRARRILPAGTVVLIGVCLWSWWSLGYVRVAQVLDDVVWASLFGANINLATSGTDYFAAADSFPSPVQHYWSLAVEEQFYLLWPALIAVVALFARRRVIRTVALTLVGLSLLSFAWCVLRTTDDPTSAYFSTFTRAWELGAGALLALGARHLRQLTKGFLTVLSWTGLAMIAWACLTYTEATAFPGRAAVLPVLGAVLVLAGGVRETPYGATYVLDRAPMRWIGDISYSLYLVHWPVLILPAAVAVAPLGAMERALLVVLAVLLAAASYRWVETPFRSATFWADSRSKALTLWPASVAVVLAVVLVIGAQTGGATAKNIDIDPLQNAATPNLGLAVDHAVTRAKRAEPLPTALTPSPLDLKDANWSLPSECWAGTEEAEHDVCTFGDKDADRTLVLYGDSHVGMWVLPVVEIAKRSGWQVKLLLKTGCPPIDVAMWRPERSDAYRECDEWRTWADEQMREIGPDRILATGYTQSLLADPSGEKELQDSEGAAGTAALTAGMLPALERLKEITPEVTLFSDTLTMRRLPADCLGGRKATLRTCAKRVDPVTVARNRAWQNAAETAEVTWVDVHPWICARNTCPLVIGNVVVYTDRHHLTRTYAEVIEPLVAKALRL